MNVSDLCSPPPEPFDEAIQAIDEQGLIGRIRAYIGGLLIAFAIGFVPDDVLEAAADGWGEARGEF